MAEEDVPVTRRAREPLPFALPAAVLDDTVVMVVDDVETNVVLLEQLLRRIGVSRVVGFTDPRSALEEFVGIAPDLVMLDFHMPHIDGVDMLRAIQGLIPPGSFLPVLVLTADATSAAKEQALTAGAKDFVTKPFEQAEVVLRVKNLLETRVLYRTLERHNAALEAGIREASEREHALAEEHEQRLRVVRHVLDEAAITMVFQPIVDLSSAAVVGVEALARFPSAAPQRPPNVWFAEAAALGLGPDMEMLAIRTALEQIDRLPDHAYLSVNASPATAVHPALGDLLEPFGERMVLELTEHAQVEEYGALVDLRDRLGRAGVRIAVDDTGAGFASFRHILHLRPAVIKLDIDLTRGIHEDPARRALAAALVTFSVEIGATIIAEGIETIEELEALRRLQVQFGQGYFLMRPGPLPVPSRIESLLPAGGEPST